MLRFWWKYHIDLDGFYKGDGIKEKGITRCALFVLLKKLLEDGLVKNTQIVYVNSPTASDGNNERLKKIYREIGFTLGEPKPGKPVNLYSSIENLLKILEKQCEISGGGRNCKRKTKRWSKSIRRKKRKKIMKTKKVI